MESAFTSQSHTIKVQKSKYDRAFTTEEMWLWAST